MIGPVSPGRFGCQAKQVVAGLLLTLCLSGNLGHAEPIPLQSKADFEAAIRNQSTAPSVVLITIIDDLTGRIRTDCTESPFLLGALQIERGIPTLTSQNLIDLEHVALENTSHVFHFSKKAALDNLGPVPWKACQAVWQHHKVRLRDMISGFNVE